MKWTAPKLAACIGAALIIANEVRGIILAGPILYVLWREGGTAMQVWLAICAVAGIAVSVAAPALAFRWWNTRRAAAP